MTLGADDSSTPQGEPVDAPFDRAEYRRANSFDIWSSSDTGHDLTVEESLFVRSYIVDRNEVAALRRLGYAGNPSTLKNRALSMLRKSTVQGAIETLAKRMMDHLEVTAERVNRGIAAMAFFDIGEVMQFDGVGIQMLPSHLWTADQRAAVTGVKMTKEGVEVKFADKQRAIEFLSKQLGLSEDEGSMQRQAAEAAAFSAMSKMLDVVARIQDQRAPAAPEPEAVEGHYIEVQSED